VTVAYAVLAGRQDIPLLDLAEYPAVLVSFALDPKGELLGGLGYRPDHVMLDSGAFSAWGSGDEVDIDQLAAWATDRQREHPGAELLNLDDIPGTPQVPPSPVEMADAVGRSADNAEYLRAAGLKVIEVFHLYEPLDVLDSIMSRRRPGERVALGGLARWTGGPGGPIKSRFCRAAFGHLMRDDGSVPSVHGLGVSPDSQWLGAAKFPWASVDSTSWSGLSRFGVGVTKNGRRLGGRSDPRVANRDLRTIYSLRVLAAWGKPHVDLWTRRGVTIRD